MNFKKFISGVSAFAIAASAFAGMAVTANAFDTVTIDYEDETPVVDWTSSNTGRYTAEVKADGENHYMSVDAVGTGNNGTMVSTNNSYAAKVAAGTSFTMTFDMQINGGNNQASTFLVKAPTGNILKLAQNGAGSTNWTINEDSTKTVTLTKSTWYSFKITRVEAEDASDDITYLTIKDANGNDVFERAIISSSLSADGGVSGMSFETKRYYAYLAMDNVVVRDIDTANDLPQTVSYKVTLNCVAQDDTETVIKTSSVYIESGEEYTPAYDTTFDDDNYRYTYVSGADTQTITAETTYTLVYSKEALAEHTVTFKATGDVEKTLGTVVVKDNKTASFNFPKYVLNGTDLCSTNTSGTNNHYTKSVSNVTADQDVEIPYTKSVDNVAFYTEGEDIDGATVSTYGNTGIRASQALAAYAENDLDVVTLPAGKYVVHASVNAWSSGGANLLFALGTNEFNFVIEGSNNAKDFASDEFELSEPATLVFKTSGQKQSTLDYIYVVKTGEYVAPAAHFNVDMGNGTLAEGDNNDVATWYIATVTNDGNAEGSFSTMTLYKNETASAPQAFSTAITINASAYVNIGVIVNGLDTRADTITATVE